MLAKLIATDIYQVSLGFVNVFLINREKLTLIDAGIPGSEGKILKAIDELGRQPADLEQILISHLHIDHIGSLNAIRQATGAKIFMHTFDAQTYADGYLMRPVQPAPGLINSIFVKLTITDGKPANIADLSPIDYLLNGGEEIPGTGGLQAIYSPGHTKGHMVFYYPGDGGVLFLGDAASNLLRLNYSFIYEDFVLGKETLKLICDNNFKIACFSHGTPIISNAVFKLKTRFSL